MKLVKELGKAIDKRSSGILIGVGIVGMVTATVMAVHATPKALMLISDAEHDKEGSLTTAEKAKVCWKCYIPAAATTILSVVLIIEGQRINTKRHAALAAAYGLSEAALKDFQEKLVEIDGEKKLDKVRKAIAKDKVEKSPVENREVIVTSKGDTLCFEPISARYFRSDADKIRKAVNDANSFLLRDGILSLNDFYYELGLDGTSIGNDIGWSYSRDDLIDLGFTSTLASDGTPCLVLEYRNEPQYKYYNY